jgi:hypothetical protein
VPKITPLGAEAALMDLQRRKLSAAYIIEMTKRRGNSPAVLLSHQSAY